MRAIWTTAPILSLAAVLAGPGLAQANTFASSELSYDNALLSQFNLINIGAFSSTGSQSIAGRAVVGGTFTTTGTQTVCAGASCSGNTALGVSSSTSGGVVNATSSSSNSTSSSAPNYGYGALTVFGSVTGSVTTTNGGDINIGGNVGAGTLNANAKGGVNAAGTSQSTTTVSGATEIRTTSAATQGTVSNSPSGATYEGTDTVAQVFAPFANSSAVANNFTTPLKNLSAGIANLPGSPGVGNNETITSTSSGVLTSKVDYTANGLSYGVITTTVQALAAAGANGFTGVTNNASNAATFVIVSGDGANSVLPTLTNNDSKVIYDFVSATTLKIGGNFDASILAPLANLTTTGTGTINGTVVVASMTQSQALFNGNAFTGNLAGLTSFGYNARVPEPASLTILGVGVAAMAALRRRKSRSAAVA